MPHMMQIRRRYKYVGTNTSPTNFRHFPHLFNPYNCLHIIISTNGLEINNLSPLLRVSSCYFMRKPIKKLERKIRSDFVQFV